MDPSKYLAQEDALIAISEDAVANALTGALDQLVANWEQIGQFTEPDAAAYEVLVDALGAGWTTGVVFGYQQFPSLLEKSDQGSMTRAALEYITNYGGSRAKIIAQTTVRQLVNLIVSGQRQGLSLPSIARQLVNRVPKIASTRAKIIAATEIHSAAQYGAYRAALRSNKTLTKVWNTVEDDRVRDFRNGPGFSHRLAHQQRAPLDGVFRIPHSSGTSESLLFPGDPAGSAGNIISCRCFATYEEV